MPLIRYLLRLYNLYLSSERDFARRVRDLVGFAPARLSIFRLAFAHKSNQRVDRATGQSAANNNERLEYLGDAVLGTIVAEYLFKKYPDADEGFLTKMRSRIVKRKSLNKIGDEMGLDVFLTELNRVRLSSSMLGNAVEALCGAVYLERGYEGTKRFVIRRMLRPYVDIDTLETTDDNYKSQLLEHCQKNGKSIAYQLLDKFKRDRRDRFRVAVLVGGKQVAEADDFNKKAAEQLASRHALAVLGAIDAPATAGAAAAPAKKKPSRRKASDRKARGRQASAPAHPRDDAPVPAADAPTSPPPGEERATVPDGAKSAKTAKTAKRRSTGISRTLHHATRTAAAALACVEFDAAPPPEPFRREAATPSVPAPPRRAPRKRRVGATASIAEAAQVAAAVLSVVGGPASGVVARPKPAADAPTPPVRSAAGAKRKRRPVPLRLLTPMVNHAAAALAIDFGAGAPRRSSANGEGLGADASGRAEADWDETPLELVTDPATAEHDLAPATADESHPAPKPPAPRQQPRRRGKRDKYDWVVSRDWVDLAPPPRGRGR